MRIPVNDEQWNQCCVCEVNMSEESFGFPEVFAALFLIFGVSALMWLIAEDHSHIADLERRVAVLEKK